MSGSHNGLRNSTVRLLPAHQPQPPSIAPTEQTAIVSEISARINEWHTTNSAGIDALDWWLRVALLAQDNPDAFWLYHALQCGDLSALTKTYQEQAKERHTDRQNIHYRHTQALKAMSTHFPELKHTITHLESIFRPARGRHTHRGFAGPSQVVPA